MQKDSNFCRGDQDEDFGDERQHKLFYFSGRSSWNKSEDNLQS